MTTKILAGIAAAVLVSLIGLYATTGSIPGLDSVTDAAGLTTSEGGSCSSCCSKAATATPACCAAEATDCDGSKLTATPTDAFGACAGGLTQAAPTATAKKKTCCEE